MLQHNMYENTLHIFSKIIHADFRKRFNMTAVNTVQCCDNAINFLPNHKKDTLKLACEGKLWDVFCEFNLWLSSFLVTAVLYAICFIGPHYSGTRL